MDSSKNLSDSFQQSPEVVVTQAIEKLIRLEDLEALSVSDIKVYISSVMSVSDVLIKLYIARSAVFQKF
jgi:hypothetical protein